MKTDRELLELAAKASGYDVSKDSSIPSGGLWISELIAGDIEWDPLADDGDAFRLATRLNILVGVGVAWTAGSQQHGAMFDGKPEGELFRATRRAIVRAAAAIGETMQ